MFLCRISTSLNVQPLKLPQNLPALRVSHEELVPEIFIHEIEDERDMMTTMRIATVRNGRYSDRQENGGSKNWNALSLPRNEHENGEFR